MNRRPAAPVPAQLRAAARPAVALVVGSSLPSRIGAVA